MRFRLLVVLAIIAGCFSCKEEKVPSPFYPRNDHEAYEHSLEQAQILSTGMGKDWQMLAKTSIEQPFSVSTPFEEVFYFDPQKAEGAGYRFSVKRGQKVEVTIDLESRDSLRLFIDLYRVDSDSLKSYRHVATAAKENWTLGFEPRRDADYVLRLQPELLRGGKFRLAIRKVPTLQFPVAGKTSRAIGSVFGDPRDGGRRTHHGVDIFARRHTPILAPTDGYIRFVGQRGIGGNVVWLYDSKRGQSLYFAHLQKLIAKRGQRVKAGDTLGTVGNTGNARTTPPHLHFGIYKNGPIDPYFHLKEQRTKTPAIFGDQAVLGKSGRLNKATELHLANALDSSVNLQFEEIVTITGISASNYRVLLADGRQGYLPQSSVTALPQPLEAHQVNASTSVFISPDLNTIEIDQLYAGDSVLILGRHQNFAFIQNNLGKSGWILLP